MIRVKERIDGAVARFQVDLKDELKEWWTHRTPVAIDYVPDLWATACTEIQMAQLEASRRSSSIFRYDTGPDGNSAHMTNFALNDCSKLAEICCCFVTLT